MSLINDLFGKDVDIQTMSEEDALKASIEEFGIIAVDTVLEDGADPEIVAQIAAEAGLDI